jgi:TPR repeat protein
MHYEGKGGPPDFAEARRLLGLAAAQGQAKAQAELGNMHQGPEDLAEAEPLPGFAAALGAHAAQDQAEAQCLLGEMHFEGKGGPIDLAEARRLCTLAAISINRRLTLALSLVVCLANSELSVLVCFFHRSYTLTVYGTVRCMEHI